MTAPTQPAAPELPQVTAAQCLVLAEALAGLAKMAHAIGDHMTDTSKQWGRLASHLDGLTTEDTDDTEGDDHA